LSIANAQRNPGRLWLWLAIVAALSLMLLSGWRQGWFTPTAQIYIELSGASGVQVGTPVKLKGFKIGVVDELFLEPNLNVRASLRIDQSRMALLGANASAKFGRDGPIGVKYIELVAGQREGPRLAAGQALVMDAGGELEDVMATVKVAVEKLAQAIGKVDPILDDTKKLTAEAADMRATVRSSVAVMLGNMEAVSAQLKRVGNSAVTVAANVDKDRAALVAEVQLILKQAEATSQSARAALKTIETGLPPALAATQATLDNAKNASADVGQILRESKADVPATVRSGRALAADAAEIAEGVKRSWPVSGMVKPAEPATLPLDGFEGRTP
jgi:phospholipid/cholesterol/gamma-HCH transport system substrate-binding protein